MRNERKENRTVKFAIIVLALTMIVLILVAGTYAKYTSTGTGEATATVAKWSFTVGDKDITTATEKFTFTLFETINEEDTTTAEENVINNKIAPGTGGSFDIVLTNNSEVDAKYSLTLAETENKSNIPIEYCVDGTNWKTTVSEAKITDKAIAHTDGTDTVTVKWRWKYDNSRDAADTALGVAAQETAPTVKVEATVTATQVD